jgi:hypothetical protein
LFPRNQGERLRKKAAKREADEEMSDDEDDEDDADDEIQEEIGYLSPLDNVDPYITFKQALAGAWFPLKRTNRQHWVAHSPHLLSAFQMKNPQAYQAATMSLNIEQQTLLVELMRKADENAAAAAAAPVA